MIQQTLQETFEDCFISADSSSVIKQESAGAESLVSERDFFFKKFGIFNFSEKVLLCSRTSLEEIFISLKA